MIILLTECYFHALKLRQLKLKAHRADTFMKIKGSVNASMKQGLLLLITLIIIFSGCKNDKGPDVSSIKVDLEVNRFEKDFFAVDTNNIYPSLLNLAKKYPAFMPDFLSNIMGLRPISDTSTMELAAIKGFLKDYRPV